MEQALIVIGAATLGVLGTIHLAYTFFTNKFDARDAKVTDLMKDTSPVLTRQTSMWNAWVGFNASHSLGAMLFGGIYIPLSLFHYDVIQQSVWFSSLPLLVGLSYLVLAKKYWFRIPFIGIALATTCFLGVALGINFHLG